VNNDKMHIEDIFEDLEAQFDSATKKDRNHLAHLEAKIAEVKTKTLSFRLIAPIIGLDFIAGLDHARPTWHIFSTRHISEVQFLEAQDKTLPKVRQLEESLSTFLNHIPLPGMMRWRTFDNLEYELIGAVRGSSDGLLLTHQGAAAKQIWVPILSLAQLSIDSIGG
jgi:hypothetical protein